MANFQNEVCLLFLKRTTWKKRRDILAFERGLRVIKVIIRPLLNICFDMQKFVLILASVYNINLITQFFTKQELPKYQSLQNPTYQTDSLKKELNEKLFSIADSLEEKILSRPHIKLSKSQTLIMDSEETGIFQLDFVQQLRCEKADVPDIYFTLLDAAGISPTLILNQNAKAKERGSSVPFKI